MYSLLQYTYKKDDKIKLSTWIVKVDTNSILNVIHTKSTDKLVYL